MKIYNTLSKRKEVFKPLSGGRVGIYTCGPTVYNYAHIGNMRTYVFEDLLKRALLFFGYSVKHVMNVTDVGHLVSDSDDGEDKMELGAAREGKSAWEIADFYTDAFFRDFSDLNCIKPHIVANATEHIQEMLDLVKRLERKGYTYRISDGIYFDTSRFRDYGLLSGKAYLDGIKAGARVEYNPEKRNPSDFALWKFSPKDKKRQMEWDSPWGRGFPGWHIECSAMSMKYLGETFDMHCGGVDHIPVHHTNEIAQSEAATGRPFVKYWVHGEFLVMNKREKMAKSSGGFITVDTLRKKGFDPLAYRYFCLGTHYRKQLDFSWEALAAAQKSLGKLREITASLGKEKGDITGLDYLSGFSDAVGDDLNIPKALAALWEAVRDAKLDAARKYAFILKADSVLGLNLTSRGGGDSSLPEEIKGMINEREEARRNRDFKKSDEIRDKLRKMGIALEDTPSGTKWRKIPGIN